MTNDPHVMDSIEEQKARFAEHFGLDADGNAPPLHEDLVPYLDDSGSFGETLRHPLVYQVPYHPQLAGQANRIYAAKLEALAKDLADKNWGSFLFLHERPYRLYAFGQIEEQLTDQEYWEYLADIWIDSENIWQNVDGWRHYLNSDRPGRYEHFMVDDDRRSLSTLVDPVPVWRGTSAPDEDDDPFAEWPGMGSGLSWTTSKKRARWFAHRFAHRGKGRVWAGTVPKAAVIARRLGRGENEIIVFPEDVENVTVTEVDDG